MKLAELKDVTPERKIWRKMVKTIARTQRVDSTRWQDELIQPQFPKTQSISIENGKSSRTTIQHYKQHSSCSPLLLSCPPQCRLLGQLHSYSNKIRR